MVTSAGLIGRVLRALGEHPDFVGRGVGGIFQRAAFVRDVPDVAVAAVDLGGGLRDRHVVLGARSRWRLRAKRCPTRATARSPADAAQALYRSARSEPDRCPCRCSHAPARRSRWRARLPPASSPAAAARWTCRADICARTRRRRAPASRDNRETNSSRMSATWTSEAPVRRALASRPVSSSPPWPISPHTATTSQP